MKTKNTLLFLFVLLALIPNMGQAQETNTIERTPEAFSALIVGGYYHITLHQGNPKIIIHSSEAVAEKVSTEVRNGVLEISNKPIRQNKPISIDLYSDYIDNFDVSGAVVIQSEEVQKPKNLNLDISGAAQITIAVETADITANLTGASLLDISGKANSINGQASGAAILKTANLETANSNIVLSGAAGVMVKDTKKEEVVVEVDDVDRSNDIQAKDENGEKTTYGVTYDGSTARAKFLGIHVNVDEDDETGEVCVGTHRWVYDSDGEVTHKRIRKLKFDGHWGGVGIGINGYVNDQFKYQLPKEYETLDLVWHKSVNVDLNVYEQNINLSHNNNIGLITGIGFSIHNYRFNKSFTVMQDSNFFYTAYNQGVNVRKSKLVTNYITVPVLFEIQDRNPNPLTKYRWHINVGAIFGVRVHAHQKTYWNDTNKDFNLTDPLSSEIIATSTSPSYPKSKVHDNFYLRPFKVDASLRVGWGWIDLYANVALTELFIKDKGPKLYPFTVGIMLVSW